MTTQDRTPYVHTHHAMLAMLLLNNAEPEKNVPKLLYMCRKVSGGYANVAIILR